jgi:hypothetical protein
MQITPIQDPFLFLLTLNTIAAAAAISATTMKIPNPIPALKMEAIASQEVRSVHIRNRKNAETKIDLFMKFVFENK